MTIDDVSVSVFINTTGWFTAMISDSAYTMSQEKFHNHSSATYEELMNVEPYLDDAKALLQQLHKEINEINADIRTDGDSLQDLPVNDEGEW